MSGKLHRAPEAETSTATASSPNPSLEPMPEFRASFDTPGHQLAGDQVPGAPVEIPAVDQPDRSVAFSPGELAALVDYVGDLGFLYTRTLSQLRAMSRMLADACEDTAHWDLVTDGRYSEIVFENEDHFAPGAGRNAKGTFVDALASALRNASDAAWREEGAEDQQRLMARARLDLYTAEHFLQDAFSAGHAVNALAVEEPVAQALAEGVLSQHYQTIAARVLDERGDVARGYALRAGVFGAVTGPIDSVEEVAHMVRLMKFGKGEGGVVDAVRAAIHERLGETGVEVRSEAIGDAWLLTSDHDLADNPGSLRALRLAMTEARDLVEIGASPGLDPVAEAEALWERHRPVPTGDGRATVERTLKAATGSMSGIADALASTMSREFPAICEAMVASTVLVSLSTAQAAQAA